MFIIGVINSVMNPHIFTSQKTRLDVHHSPNTFHYGAVKTPPLTMTLSLPQAFREQRIDGSALPLLTEEHLTSSINMKLGPALKLRSVLARRLGACNVCLHCDHCHSQTQERRPSSASSGQ